MMFPPRNILFMFMFVCCIVVGECYSPAQECETLDCPPYSVIHSENEYEIRNYNESLWVSSSTIIGDSIMDAFGRGGHDLGTYYGRGNEQGVFIKRGPAMMDVLSNSSYTVYYYVPKKYQNSGLPKPLTPEITQVKLPKYKYAAVTRFINGFSDDVVAQKVDALKKNLQNSTFQRANLRDQFSYLIYNSDFSGNYEVLIWFD